MAARGGTGRGFPAAARASVAAVEPGDELMKSFELAAVDSSFTGAINSIDFARSGDTMVTSSDDDAVRVFDCEAGSCRSTFFCKKYGAALARVTHHPTALLLASRKGADHAVRYFSAYDNRYLRYFAGHRARVVSLEQSPKDDTFISAAADGEVRVWDARAPACAAAMRTDGRPAVGQDPSGVVFGVASSGSARVNLFDARNYGAGPFISAALLLSQPGTELTGLKFSPDGTTLLVSTTGSEAVLVDSFKGSQLRRFFGHQNDRRLVLEASFSADGGHVLSGSEDGTVHVWNAATGEDVAVLGGHIHPVTAVRCNPRRAMLATACQSLGLWLPSPGRLF